MVKYIVNLVICLIFLCTSCGDVGSLGWKSDRDNLLGEWEGVINRTKTAEDGSIDSDVLNVIFFDVRRNEQDLQTWFTERVSFEFVAEGAPLLRFDTEEEWVLQRK